jgi:hypothetical protein
MRFMLIPTLMLVLLLVLIVRVLVVVLIGGEPFLPTGSETFPASPAHAPRALRS